MLKSALKYTAVNEKGVYIIEEIELYYMIDEEKHTGEAPCHGNQLIQKMGKFYHGVARRKEELHGEMRGKIETPCPPCCYSVLLPG